MKRSALVLLILCNLVWTFNPVMGKVLLRVYGGLQVAWIRYFGAFLSYAFVVAGILVLNRKKTWREYFLIPKDRRTWLELLAVSIGPFVFSPILQFIGLETAQAMDNSILIATEPLMTVLLAWVVLGERMTRSHWISLIFAVFGFFLFSGLVGSGSGEGIVLSAGMFLLLVALLGESAFSVFSRSLVLHHAPTAVIGSALSIGAVVLSCVIFFFSEFPALGAGGWPQLGAALWLGPMGSTLTYLIWALIARKVTVASMAITLFVQPLVGAAVGVILLGEGLTLSRGLGAGLILIGIAVLLYWEFKQDLKKNACGV